MPQNQSFPEAGNQLGSKDSQANQVLIHNAPIGVFKTTPEGRYIFANPALARMYGYDSPEELVNAVTDIGAKIYVDPGDREEFKRLVERDGQVVNHESRLYRRDGSVFWASRNAWAVRDEGGNIVHYQGFTTEITERKQAEAKLKAERDYLFRIFDTISQYVFVCTSDYTIEFSNRSARNMFGELEGKTCYKELYQNTRCPNCPMGQSTDPEISEPVGYTIEIYGRILEGTATKLANLDGSVSVLEVCEDVTDRIQAEKEKQTSEAQLRALVDTLPDLVWLKDQKGLYLRCNQRFERFFGAREAEIFGKTDYDFVSKELADFFRAKDKEAMDAGQPCTNEEEITFAQDGHTEILETIKTPMFDFDGQLIGVLGIGRDITYRKRTERLLQESEETYRNLFHNAQVGIFRTRIDDGKIIESNDQLAHMFGYTSREDIIDNYFSAENYVDPGTRERMVNEIQKKGSIHNYEARFYRQDGSIFWALFSARIYPEQGWIEGVAEDITDLKETEKEKLQAQKTAIEHEKYALVGQIAGKMAHDFNNILAGVLGNAELALLNCPHEPTREALELIVEQANRGKNLTKNLVAFARDQEPKQEYFQVKDKIELVLNLMKKDLERITILRDDAPDLPDILADPGMIEHALVNLIQNSIQALSKTGRPQMAIRTYGTEQRIWIEIEDNGCGIPQEYLDRIFEPAFTLKGSRDATGSYVPGIKGTGYGMANVKKYIEQHKGSISVESQTGQGTHIVISLPIIHKELTPKEITEIEQTASHFNKYILLVEDEQTISDVQYRILTNEPCNHKVDIAHNGRMAIELLKRNTYDLVSLDYVLPGETTGMDVYRYIRKTNADIPVLFISGNLEFLESMKELQDKDPHVDHVTKPCLQKEYIQAIDKLLMSDS
jgi:PAS domain S-box-containing protein